MPQQFENLVDLCEKSCKKFKDRELFGTKTDGAWKWNTYGEFEQLVSDFRGGLASLGVGAGDKVGMIANNRVEWAVAAYATYGLGAAFVPMYEAQKADEWRFILDDCGAKVAIGATPDIYKKLQGLKDQVPSLEHVIGLEEPESDDHSYAALLKKGAASPKAAVHPKDGDTAGFIYTSGTTGNPKGVILSHGNICSNINAIHAIFPFETSDRSLSFLPWAHSFGQTCELQRHAQHGLFARHQRRRRELGREPVRGAAHDPVRGAAHLQSHLRRREQADDGEARLHPEPVPKCGQEPHEAWSRRRRGRVGRNGNFCRRQHHLLQDPPEVRRAPEVRRQRQRGALERGRRVHRRARHQGLRGLRPDRDEPDRDRELPGQPQDRQRRQADPRRDHHHRQRRDRTTPSTARS